MSQSKLQSLTEGLTNIAIGYVINFGVQVLVFPWFGIHISIATNIYIGLVFTVVAIARQYVVRRWFNKKGENGKS